MISGTFGGGLQHHRTGAEVSQHLVRDGGLGEVHAVQRFFLAGFDPLANRLGDLLRFAGTIADHAFAGISDDDERGEGHVLTALDDLGDAIDGDDLVLEVQPVCVNLFLCNCHNVLIQLSGYPCRAP